MIDRIAEFGVQIMANVIGTTVIIASFGILARRRRRRRRRAKKESLDQLAQNIVDDLYARMQLPHDANFEKCVVQVRNTLKKHKDSHKVV